MHGAGRNVAALALQRFSYLRAVATTARTKDDIERAVADSRSTVDRVTRELEQRNLIERTDDGYRLTLAGVLIHAEVVRLCSRVGGIVEAVPALRDIAPDADLEAAVFEDAAVTVPAGDTPRGPVDDHSALLEGAERVRSIGSVVHPQLVEVYYRRVVKDGMAASVLLSERVLERLVAVHPDRLQEALALAHFELRRTEAEFPYGQVLADLGDEIAVGVLTYGDSEINGFVSTRRTAGIQWAEHRFERLWESGTPVETPRAP